MEEEKKDVAAPVAMGEEKEGVTPTNEEETVESVKFVKLDESEEEKEMKAKANYSSSDIQVLKGLEPVRERPGMYIGTTSGKGLHHLIREIVDNSVDEALAGYCHNISIVLEKNGSVTVADDGRGIPCDVVSSTGLSGVETVYTILHAGGKFEGGTGYKVSGGLHGVGASVVNALSKHVTVTVYRNGIIHQIDFENGGHTVAPGLREVGTCPLEKTGTTVNFIPDNTIFTETTVFNYEEVRESIRQTAYLNRGLSLSLTDAREEPAVSVNYCFHGGIAEFVNYLNGGKPIVFPDIIYFDGKSEDGVFAECAFQPTKTSVFTMKSFCNNIRTAGGGTHEDGFRLAFGREVNKYFRDKEFLKKDDDNFSWEDLTEGLTVVISVKHPDPQYEGQVKDKLGNAEVKRDVSSIVGDQLATWLSENPKLGRLVYERVLLAYKGRKAAERAKEAVLGKGGVGGIPDKLADCISKDPEQRELFIVEGNSAGGSAKSGRDAYTQAILPLRGKILNIEKAAATRIEKNNEIENMIQAIGAGYAENFDITKIKYHKVIIMTDADVDGSHIRILLLTFFYRYMKPLVEGGYVYIAQPPLYKLTYQGHDYYCFKEEELQPLKDKLPANARFALQRYKGLGEMDASQLAETTMEKTKRKMWKVSVQDAEEADNALSDLMGENVVPRKDFITANAKFVKNLDIN
jgi:DNA gyrase subunit B